MNIAATAIILTYLAYLLLCARSRRQSLKAALYFAQRRIVRLEEACESRQKAIDEWRMAANVLREDNKALGAGNRYLRARRRVIFVAWFRRRQKRTMYPAWVVMDGLPR